MKYALRTRILVIGGAGFLGSHLCERLLAEGHDVICLDNFFTGAKDNIADLLDNPYSLSLPRSAWECRPDAPRREAGAGASAHGGFRGVGGRDAERPKEAPTRSVGASWGMKRGSRLGGSSLPRSAWECRPDAPRREAGAGASAHGGIRGVGGRDAERPEEAPTRSVGASWGEAWEPGGGLQSPRRRLTWQRLRRSPRKDLLAKGRINSSLQAYCRQHGMRIKVARIFNIDGPRMHPNDGRVVSNFIVQALQNKPITIDGEGTQTRSFCSVDDLIEGFVRLMNSPDDLAGPVNLGNPGEFTMIELAETILELTGSGSALVHAPLPQDDPRQRKPDIGLARAQLGWEPRVALREGLMPTIAYFDGLLGRSAGGSV